MCNKIDFRIECYKCGYPASEALYPDDYTYSDEGLPCNLAEEDYDVHTLLRYLDIRIDIH